MASRKNLVLASLVSLIMVLSFGIGLVPMLTVSPDQSAKAAPGAVEVAISVDGSTPVGASYAIPVGGEQGFSALRLLGDSVESLAGGAVEWSLATDGSAKLVSAADAAVATVQAVAPGEAGLYVRTADGLVAVVELSFYEMKAVPAKVVENVTVTSPVQGANIVVQTGTVTPLTLTAETDDPSDVEVVRYLADTLIEGVDNYSTTPPYAVVIPDVRAMADKSVTAEALSIAGDVYVSSAEVTFSIQEQDLDGAGENNANGIPDDPFSAGLGLGDVWTSTVGGRTVGMTPLGLTAGKAIVLPEDGVSVTLADPDNAARWVRVTAPAGLVPAGQSGLLLVAIGDTPTDLLGATQAANIAVEPSTLVLNGQYVSVNILIQDGATWSSLTDVTDNPVVIEMGGLGVTDNESAAFAVHPSTAVETGGDTEIQVAAGGTWEKAENGTLVALGEMSAELTTLGVVAPYEFALSPNILTIAPASVSNLGGDSVRIGLENVTDGQAVTVTIGGQAVAGTVDTDGQGTGVTVTVPVAAMLDSPASTATVDVRVDTGDDFDAVNAGLTILGPQIGLIDPAAGGPGATITITGSGFQDDPGTTVVIGGVALTIDSITATEIVGHFGNIIPNNGPQLVVITNANQYVASNPIGFTVTVGAPVLNDVAPDSVYAGAEYTLDLTGANFVSNSAKQQEASAAVYFGATDTPNLATDVRAASFTTMSDGLIRAKTPATLAPGTHHVYVATLLYTDPQNETVQVSDTLPVEFIDPADAQVTIATVAPSEGLLAGGTLVTITGTGLFPATNLSGVDAAALMGAAGIYADYNVFFGVNEAIYVSATPTEITVETPAGAFAGSVDVRVENPFATGPGNFAVLADGFTYVQPTLAVSPLSAFSATGPLGGPLNLFTPGSKDFEVTNSGTGTLNWTASVDVDWIDLSLTGGSLEGGLSATSTATLNTDVLLLAEGTHTATITFNDDDDATNPIQVAVSVVIGPATEPILGVSPAADLVSSGEPGGPFSPSNIDYTVANTGGGTLNWTASANQSWVTVAPGSGSNTNAASTTVNVSLNAQAASLAPGLHTATVTFSDGTTSVTREVELTVNAPVMLVIPDTGFNSFGPFGGPFAPLSQTYMVYNMGTGDLVWDANLVYTGDAPTWLTLTKDLAPQAGSVTAAINDNAGTLPGSGSGTTYTATIEFSGTGGTTTRTVSLTVYAKPSITLVKPRNIAPPTGGLTVYLTGTNFMTSGGTTRVFFTNTLDVADPATDVEGTNVRVFSDTQLAVDTPVHAEGDFNVYVVNSLNTPGGLIEQSSGMLPFIFAAPTLTVSTINPEAGPIEGNTDVTITGSNFPDPGSVTKSKQVDTTGTTLALADAVYNTFGIYSTIRVDMSLLRGPQADPLNGPAAITGSFLFDPAVLEFVSITRNLTLRNWYSKSIEFALDQYEAGKVNFVISSGTTEITTFDNQIPDTEEEPHDPNAQINPFPMGYLTFRAVTTNSIQSAIEIYDLAMVDSDALDFPNFTADDGSVKIVGASAELQLEDQTVSESVQTVDVDISLFRPEGSNLLVGPNTIEFNVQYDASILTWAGVLPSAQLGDWYDKGFTVIDVDPVAGVVTLLISDLAKALAEITTVEPGTQNQLNPFPLGTLQFSKKEGADLNGVEPFVVIEPLTMLDKDAQPFPGGAGIGDVGTIAVTELPEVFFGANAGTVTSSTSTQIGATTPPGDRRDTVDVLVVDPTQPEPGNYGFKADSFTYEQPGIGVTPETDFLATGTLNSAVFDPASATYEIYNIYNGTLNWTATVDQTWVTLSAAAGSVVGDEIDSLIVTIDASAQNLGVGLHEATITFGGNGGTVTRTVSLTITGASTLNVDPDPGVEFTGPLNGPFQPASRAFTVYNPDAQSSLSWTVSTTANWVNLSPASGVNNGTVTVTLTAAAAQLPLGTHVANVTFNSAAGTTIRTVTLTVLPLGEPAMSVSPETGLNSSGPAGGPFAPPSTVYTVANAGGSVLTYTAVAEASWVYVLNPTGSVIGGQSTPVTVMIDQAVAATLPAADVPHQSTVTFDDGNAATPPITRTVTLTVFSLTVTAPNGGEEVQRGDVIPITWTYLGPSSNNQVRIELINATTSQVVDTLAMVHSNVQGANSFDWAVSASAPLGRNFKIQVRSLTDNRITDASNAAFAIIEPVFEVLHPAAGETVPTGQTFTLEWNYYEIGTPDKANELVDIYLYQGDTEIRRIANNVPNQAFDEINGANTFDWAVPATLAIGPGYRIVFKDSDGEAILGGMPVGGTGFEITRGGGGGLGAILLGLLVALLGLAGGGGDGGGGGPCFIATAAYGTPMAAQIDTLRDFRDMYMLSNPLGMAAADAYYQISPAIADVVAKYPVLAALVRIALVPVVLMAKLAVAMPIPSMVLAGFGMVMLALRRLRRSRKA